MDRREMFTIDGRRFSNMAGFYDEVEQVFICGLDWKIGGVAVISAIDSFYLLIAAKYSIDIIHTQ